MCEHPHAGSRDTIPRDFAKTVPSYMPVMSLGKALSESAFLTFPVGMARSISCVFNRTNLKTPTDKVDSHPEKEDHVTKPSSPFSPQANCESAPTFLFTWVQLSRHQGRNSTFGMLLMHGDCYREAVGSLSPGRKELPGLLSPDLGY